MKKSVFLKNAKLLALFVMVCSFFIGCSNIISTSNDSSDSSSIASVSEIERLALIALSENYTTSVSEMEKNLIDFISDNSSDSNDSSRSADSKSYTISLSKQDSVPVLFSQTKSKSERSCSESTTETDVPIYFYDIANKTDENTKDLAIMTTDRRIGSLLAYIENCSVEDLNDASDGNPAAIFYANLPGYIKTIADIWNKYITEDYLDAVRNALPVRSVETTVVTSHKYGYKDWKCLSKNEDSVITKNVAKNISQTNYKDIVWSNLRYKFNGCGPVAAMQIQCFHRFPEQISIDVCDEDGINYMGNSIWSNTSFAQMLNTDDFSDAPYVLYKSYKAKKEVASDIKKYIDTHPEVSSDELKIYLEEKVRDKANEAETEKLIYEKSNKSLREYMRYRCDLEKSNEYNTYLSKLNLLSIEDIYSKTNNDIDLYNKSAKTQQKRLPNKWYEDYMNLCALMYQTVKGMNAVETESGTSVTTESLPIYLKSVGYIGDDICSYSFSEVKKSIDSGYPIPIRGGTGKYIDNGEEKEAGHYWVIDGYARYYCSYYEGDKDNIIGNMTADYVHVNWGWSGNYNGYYMSGVFDSNYLPFVRSEKDVYSTSKNRSVTDEAYSNEKGYYQHNLLMVPNLHPNR